MGVCALDSCAAADSCRRCAEHARTRVRFTPRVTSESHWHVPVHSGCSRPHPPAGRCCCAAVAACSLRQSALALRSTFASPRHPRAAPAPARTQIYCGYTIAGGPYCTTGRLVEAALKCTSIVPYSSRGARPRSMGRVGLLRSGARGMTVSILGLCLGLAVAVCADGAKRPNIVFFLTDDQDQVRAPGARERSARTRYVHQDQVRALALTLVRALTRCSADLSRRQPHTVPPRCRTCRG